MPPTGSSTRSVALATSRRVSLYAVNLAFVEHSEISIAVVGDGSSGTVLVAQRGMGAWSLGDQPPIRLVASGESRIVDLEGWPAPGRDRDRAAEIAAAAIRRDRFDVRCLSTTLSLAYVAAGRIASCLLFSAPSPVHVAAGALLAKEAGALVSDLEGRAWTMGSPSLLASGDEAIHHEVLALLESGGPSIGRRQREGTTGSIAT